MGCVLSLFFYYYHYYDQMKNTHTKVSLFLHPPHSVALVEPDWRGNLIRSGQKSERDTLHHTGSHGSWKCPTPLSSSCPNVHHSFPRSPTFPVPPLPPPPIFPILLSIAAPSSSDTRHTAASQVSPFSSTASLLWWRCSAVVLTAHSFPCFPHSDLCSAPGPQRNGSLPCLLTCCCVCLEVCVGEQRYHVQLNMPNDD